MIRARGVLQAVRWDTAGHLSLGGDGFKGPELDLRAPVAACVVVAGCAPGQLAGLLFRCLYHVSRPKPWLLPSGSNCA